tara:strand:+ start:11171 stop:11635 length:465 start_codon:yes stop_codon:yes gene_type:complete
MELNKAIKKIEKYLGTKIERPDEIDGRGRFYVEVDGYVGSFYASKKWGSEDEYEASNWHIRSVGDVSDPHTDYYAGSFRDNCTQWLHALKRPEPKFPVGCLVRGKDNKRANRQGFAGKVGLVTSSGSYCHIDWLGEPEPHYKVSFSERDLELVS